LVEAWATIYLKLPRAFFAIEFSCKTGPCGVLLHVLTHSKAVGASLAGEPGNFRLQGKLLQKFLRQELTKSCPMEGGPAMTIVAVNGRRVKCTLLHINLLDETGNPMQQYKRDFLDLALRSGALTFGEFTLKSG